MRKGILLGGLLSISLAGCGLPFGQRGTLGVPQITISGGTATADFGYKGGRDVKITIGTPQTGGFSTQSIAHRWTAADVYEYDVTLSRGGGPLVTVPVHCSTGIGTAVFSHLQPGVYYTVSVVAKGNIGGTSPDRVINSQTPATGSFDLTASNDLDNQLAIRISVVLDSILFDGQGSVNLAPIDGGYILPTASESGFCTCPTPAPTPPGCVPDSHVGSFQKLTTTALNVGRDLFRSIVIGNYWYVVGGIDASHNDLASIEAAPILPDGNIGSFSIVPSPLVMPDARFGMQRIGNYLYVLGGSVAEYTDGGAYSTVQRAPINPDGTLGAFTTQGVPQLTVARYGPDAQVTGNYLYVFGGRMAGGGGDYNSIEAAPINPDGTIGAFAIVPATLAIAMDHIESIKLGNYFYLLGGYTFPSRQSYAAVQQAAINPDGTIASFTTIGVPTLPGATLLPSAQVIASNLYVLGGDPNNSGPGYGGIARARIAPDGSLGAFQTICPAMTEGRAAFGSAVIGNNLYVVGGNDNGAYLSSVERAPIQ